MMFSFYVFFALLRDTFIFYICSIILLYYIHIYDTVVQCTGLDIY